MWFKGGEMDNNNNQHKTKRMSHHLLHKEPTRKQKRLNRWNIVNKIKSKWILVKHWRRPWMQLKVG